MGFLPELRAAVQFSCLLEQFAIFFLFYNMEVTFPSQDFVGDSLLSQLIALR